MSEPAGADLASHGNAPPLWLSQANPTVPIPALSGRRENVSTGKYHPTEVK